jgi:hypothetical protein
MRREREKPERGDEEGGKEINEVQQRKGRRAWNPYRRKTKRIMRVKVRPDK